MLTEKLYMTAKTCVQFVSFSTQKQQKTAEKIGKPNKIKKISI